MQPTATARYSRLEEHPLEPESNGTRVLTWRIKWSAYRTHATLCVGLHVILVIMHALLLLVCVQHREHALSFEFTPFSLEWYPLAATTLMQVFGTIILAILVAATQSLAFRSDLYVRQTLTALHDKSGAWLGLGAACTSLWSQFKLRTAVDSIICISAYLLGVWLLHITIPTALNVVPYNATTTMVNRTVLANVTRSSANSATAYDILLFSDQVPTLGLRDNIVYDIIPSVPFANGSAQVNASVYNVDCAAIPATNLNATLTNAGSTGVPSVDLLLLYLNSTEGFLQTMYAATAPYSAAAIYTGIPLYITDGCDENTETGYQPGSCWAPILILSTVAIVDASGAQPPVPGSPWVSIDPLVTVVPYPTADPAVLISGVQLLACSVGITNTKTDVSVETRTPLSPPSKPRTDTLWRNWTWPDDLTLTDQLRAAQNVPYFSPPSGHGTSLTVAAGFANLTVGAPPLPLPGFDNGYFRMNPPEDYVSLNSFLSETSSVTVVPTAFDLYLAEDLRLASEYRTTVTVAEINHSMAKALAAVAWYGNSLNYSSSHAVKRLVPSQITSFFGGTGDKNMTLVAPTEGRCMARRRSQ